MNHTQAFKEATAKAQSIKEEKADYDSLVIKLQTQYLQVSDPSFSWLGENGKQGKNWMKVAQVPEERDWRGRYLYSYERVKTLLVNEETMAD